MKKFTVVCLVLLVFFSGCLLVTNIKILSADASEEKILINIKSNKWVEAKVSVEDRSENLFCEKTVDLHPDDNLIEIPCKLTETRIKIIVSTEEKVFSRKLTLKSGEAEENQNNQNIDQNKPEEKKEVEPEYTEEEAAEIALILAEKTIEGQFMEAFEKGFSESGECTAQKYIENKNKITKEFPEFKVPELNLNESQMNQLQEQINETRECNCYVKKEATEKESNKFTVNYSLACEGYCGEVYFEPFTQKNESISTQIYSEGDTITGLKGFEGEKYFIEVGAGGTYGFEKKITLSLYSEDKNFIEKNFFSEGPVVFYNEETGKKILMNSITITKIIRAVAGETEIYSASLDVSDLNEYQKSYSVSFDVDLKKNSVQITKGQLNEVLSEQTEKLNQLLGSYELMDECLKAWIMKVHEKVLSTN
ncbi:MAG: hypothetical protein ABH986_04275 [archaeon]